MQSSFTTHITPAEWRWVIFVSVGLVLVAFLPFLLLLLDNGAGPGWQFMGMLHHYRDGATYLSKMKLGQMGDWGVHFQHTPEPHMGAIIQLIYPLLGHVARLTSLPPIVLFHVARVAASIFMYMAIYQLGAAIWMRLRTRRVFFVLLSLGSGFGWLYLVLTGGQVDTPDLSIPEAFPFYSSLVNLHFPLTIGCLALLVGIIISAFRPGANEEPSVTSGGLMAALLSLSISFLYPQALIPVGGALTVFVLVHWIGQGHLTQRELRWLMVIIAPAVPMAVYYLTVILSNPAVAEWNRQNVTPSPSPLVLALGFGVPLLIALPGIYRALRRFEADGDQFMIIWLLVMLAVIYLPTNIQRRFALGMMIPIVYFATRALEDFWFQYMSRRWRYRVFAMLVPFIAFSHFSVLFTPLLPLITNQQEPRGVFIRRDYVAAFDWLNRRLVDSDVVLASEAVSLWLPGWVRARVVYGHPFETLDAEVKQQQVLDWFDSRSSGNCQALLERYRVRFVIYGPDEQALGETDCLGELQPVFEYGSVTVYAV